ncbi:MAG: ATP-binding cassette domain-containing protein [Chromatiales bacterium]|nr:ATP-binding cassette domain-containing protein [Chromatiales bacterium]
MILLRMEDICLAFGDQPLLVEAAFTIEAGERVCLIGRNGAGKTSLFRLITGTLQPDSGVVERRNDLRISQLDQQLPAAGSSTVRELVATGLDSLREIIDQYEALASRASTPRELHELEALQQRLDAEGGWNIEQRIDTMLTELGLPGEKRLSELSGGWRRRVALARALVSRPDLLLLDEPTNHLDLSTIEWLEQTVRGYQGSVLFITHDRAFLDRLATRIVELDRGRLLSWPGNYRSFLRRKEEALDDEATQNARFDRKLAEEEAWIRQGIKARRHRNQNRVRALMQMREERARRLAPQGRAHISIDEAEQSGRKVITARNVSHGYGDELLIRDFSCRIRRGDRVGLIGNNGVGKSTLLRILMGEITPRFGTVQLGTNLQVGYFDQLRADLDLEKTVAEVVGDGRDYVEINGGRRHVIGYLKGFLFSPKRALQPVKALSGGERNRIILARLFATPTNLLVLDEPTNDLDVETLEVLEDRLAEYSGTLIAVSHDREFLDNVVTSTLVFEDDGMVREYVGGYSDWLRQGRGLASEDQVRRGATAGRGGNERRGGQRPNKLSYKLQRELDGLPRRIEALESRVADLQAMTADPGFYERPGSETGAALEALAKATAELEGLTSRWVELEDQRSQISDSASASPGSP